MFFKSASEYNFRAKLAESYALHVSGRASPAKIPTVNRVPLYWNFDNFSGAWELRKLELIPRKGKCTRVATS